MKKFSILEKSAPLPKKEDTRLLNKNFNGISAKDIKNTLLSIDNCKSVKLDGIHLIIRVKDGDEICDIDDIENGSRYNPVGDPDYGDVISLEEDRLYALQIKFVLTFGKLKSDYFYERDGKQSDVWCDEVISLDHLSSIYSSISKNTESLKEDFYIFTNLHGFSDTNNHGMYITQNLEIELISKDRFDKSQILN